MEQKLGQTLNGGMKLNVMVPIEDCENIEHKVDQEIRLNTGGFEFIGVLNKVQTQTLKSEEGDVEIWKKLSVTITAINSDEGHFLEFPENKTDFQKVVTVVW